MPDELRGRVNSVRILCDLGGAAIDTLLGGLVAGLTTPFWIAGVLMLVVAACAWRPSGEADAHLRADKRC